MPFRFIVQNWLRQTARQQVMAAAQQHVASAANRVSLSGDGPQSDFALVFALGIEAGGLVDLLSDVTVMRGDGFTVRRGRRRDRNIVLAECGAGRAKAAKAAHALIDAHRPRWLFSAGLAGALDRHLLRGQIVVADSIVDPAGRQWTAGPQSLPPWLADVPGVHVGRLLTVDRVVRLPEEKLALGREHAALAADMESLAVAEVCAERGMPFLAVRAISDTVDEQLPPDVERLLAQKTNAARLGAALGSICRRPSSVKDLLKLQEDANAASDRLGNFLAAVMKHLPTG
jgi:adenosylhomocysteine nucleosidase